MIRKATTGDARRIAELHEELLGDSIFVRLGRPFLEGFYYSLLAEDDVAFAYVCEEDGSIIGFAAMAASHKRFYAQVRKRFLRLGFAIMRSIVAKPTTVTAVCEAAGFMLRKDGLITCDAEGELLQIAVHPDYRARGPGGKETPYFATKRVRVAQELFMRCMDELAARGIKDYRIMTGDANTSSNPFYARMGCVKVEGGVIVFGHPTSVYRGTVEGTRGLFSDTGV